MVEDIEWEKRFEEFQKSELAQQEPIGKRAERAGSQKGRQRPSKHHRDIAEPAPSLGGSDSISEKRGKRGRVTQRVSPWEKRERGGLYYTRSRKEGGRVVREYIGTGPLAELAAKTDALKRLRREEEAKAWREERESLKALDQSVEELYEAAEILARATLLAAGYHQHNRGEWRKKRG